MLRNYRLRCCCDICCSVCEKLRSVSSGATDGCHCHTTATAAAAATATSCRQVFDCLNDLMSLKMGQTGISLCKLNEQSFGVESFRAMNIAGAYNQTHNSSEKICNN